MEKQLYTLKRQKELIKINRVLAFMVVMLAFSTGSLLALRQNLISSSSDQHLRRELGTPSQGLIVIPSPSPSGLVSLLFKARYDRAIQGTQISKTLFEKLLWSAQGKITPWGERTVPSYKSAFPVDLVVLIQNVQDMEPGLYRFDGETQGLRTWSDAPSVFKFPETLPAFLKAPVIIGTVSKTTTHQDMVWLEAGGIAQNLLLSAEESGFSTFLMPSSSLDTDIKSQFVAGDEQLLWLMPFGIKAQDTNF